MSLGNAIQICRNKLNLTQKELSIRAGLAEITIRKYEADERYPKIEQMKKLANGLGITVKELHDLEFCLDNNISIDNYQAREKEIERQGIIYGKLELLNEAGQLEVLNFTDNIIKIPEYRKDKPPAE